MDIEAYLDRLEQQFAAQADYSRGLAAAATIEVTLGIEPGRRRVAARGGVLLAEAMVGRDCVMGFEVAGGGWWLIRHELVHSMRVVQERRDGGESGAVTFAELLEGWRLPLVVRAILRGEGQGQAMRIVGLAGGFALVQNARPSTHRCRAPRQI